MPDWSSIADQLRQAGIDVRDAPSARPVGGGDISAAWRLQTADGAVFLKTGPVGSYDMFEAEAEGLAELAAAQAVRVPKVFACGQQAGTAYLATEWLDLQRGGRDVELALGEQLAEMHRTTKERFGWHRDNTIGLTPQPNPWTDDWVEFYREHRLKFQFDLAAKNGFRGELQELGARLMKRLPVYFEHYEPSSSLLHGDLWGGNWSCCDGAPVIFDPAVYYGDREADLAMTRVFGGFGRAFYEAYEASWPLEPGHRERDALYQLYHILNHLNLFGSGYLGRALSLLRGLL